MAMTTVPCPYCHDTVDLKKCRIVSKRYAAHSEPAGYHEDLPEDDEVPGPGRDSGEQATVIVFDPKRFTSGSKDRKGRGRSSSSAFSLFGSTSDSPTPLLTSLAGGDPLATFECSECNQLLPQDVEQRIPISVGVLGTPGAGKTSFIATTLGQAKSQLVLDPFGIRDFRATIETEDRFHNDYWKPVFSDRMVLEATPPVRLAELARSPLTFTATVRGVAYRLYFRDLPGEAIRKRETRVTALSFIRHADALVFLIDPWGFEEVRTRLSHLHLPGHDRGDPGFTQSGLINAIAEELGPAVCREIPVAFAITKSDLVFEAFGNIHDDLHAEDAEPGERRQQILHLGTIVRREVLPLLSAPDLESSMNRFTNVSMHLIASIGSHVEADGRAIGSFDPSRGSDPLLSVLHRIDI